MIFFFNKFSNVQISLKENVCIKICCFHKMCFIHNFNEETLFFQKQYMYRNLKYYKFSKDVYKSFKKK